MNRENAMKRKKARTWKVVITILFLCMAAMMNDKMPAGRVEAEKYYISYSGYYTYSVNEDGTTVTFTGYSYDGFGTAPDIFTTFVVPDSLDGKAVTIIGDGIGQTIWGGRMASVSWPACTSVIIPEGVTSVGDYAFYGCSNLSSIALPSSVMSIGDSAFEDCSSLSSITLPEGLMSIGDYAFCNCSSLSSITIPEGVTGIGDYAFFKCSSLSSITLPEGITSIGDSAFEDCISLNSITLPEGVTSIEHSTFAACSSLSSITLPESVMSIGDYAFWKCSGLSSITIPSGVTSIGEDAFYDCPDTMIVYADAGSFAATYAKEMGFTVKPIEKPPTPPSTSDGDTKPADTPTPPSTSDEDTKPSDTPTTPSTGGGDTEPAVTPAASGTVLNVSNLQCTVKVVSSDATNPTVTYTGTTNKKAFTVTVPATVTVDNITYKVTGIAASAFKNNKKIKKVTVGANVTTIGKQAFYGCKKLKTITIKTPNLTSKTIGSKAFKGIDSKATIKVPKSKLASYKKLLKAKGVSSKATIKK